MAGKKRSHCPKGHPMTPENTYSGVDGDGRKNRRCRQCKIDGAARKRREAGVPAKKAEPKKIVEVRHWTRGEPYKADASDPAVRRAAEERMRVLERHPHLKAYMTGQAA